MMIRLENVLKISLQDILNMSWGGLQNVFKTSWRCLEGVFARCLEDVWKTFERVLARRLQNALDVFKTSSRRFEDILKRFLKDVLKTSWKTSWRLFGNFLKKTWKRLEEVLKTHGQEEYSGLEQDILKTSSEDKNERQIQDVFIKTDGFWMGSSLVSKKLWDITFLKNFSPILSK